MSRSQQKTAQYLSEAYAAETGLVRELQAQIAMAPAGRYRSALESHLTETRNHAARVQERLRELGEPGNPLQLAVGIAESAASQLLALSRAPLALLRGSSGEEKLLKNAKDACATEALEIATYTALEQLARAVGDELTAELAISIRADEQRMLDRVMRELPQLTAAVVRAEVDGSSRYEIADTGAADAVREIADAGRQVAQKQARRKAGSARKVSAARGKEPWPGYDELSVADIRSELANGRVQHAAALQAYERSHKNRAGVIRATARA